MTVSCTEIRSTGKQWSDDRAGFP